MKFAVKQRSPWIFPRNQIVILRRGLVVNVMLRKQRLLNLLLRSSLCTAVRFPQEQLEEERFCMCNLR